jgi:aspartate carbamoyltransferase catalytic subunit
MNMELRSKDLLGIKYLSAEEIGYILDTADTMNLILDSGNKKTPHLQGRSVITLFYENSTRTRMSFELAGKYLGANCSNIAVASSSIAKGETLIDTVKTLDMMSTDVLIIRHSMAGAPNLAAKNFSASVINAGDGINEHPTQALLDVYTLRKRFKDLKGVKIAIVGDILHSRVARSNIYALKKLGADISIAGPATLIPRDIELLDIKVFNTVQEAIIDAQAIIALRIQLERQSGAFIPSIREYFRFFGIDDYRLKLADENVFILHPGPVNRGIELTSDIIDGSRSLINEQVRNGVAVRMALLYLLTRRNIK